MLDALGRGLVREFPNPDRTGCPGSDVLKRIASHEMPLAEAEKWLDHLTSCSPCYSDFSQFQAAYHRRRTRSLLAIAASILIVAGVASWVLFLKQRQPVATEAAVLDLRNRSVPRGGEANPVEPPLEVARNASYLEIYLPLGSSDGPYNLRITTPKGDPIFTTVGLAKIRDGLTSVRVEPNLSSATPGLYVLQLQKVGAAWNKYLLQIR